MTYLGKSRIVSVWTDAAIVEFLIWLGWCILWPLSNVFSLILGSHFAFGAEGTGPFLLSYQSMFSNKLGVVQSLVWPLRGRTLRICRQRGGSSRRSGLRLLPCSSFLKKSIPLQLLRDPRVLPLGEERLGFLFGRSPFYPIHVCFAVFQSKTKNVIKSCKKYSSMNSEILPSAG